MKLIIQIPCFNEESQLPTTLAQLCTLKDPSMVRPRSADHPKAATTRATADERVPQ